MINKDDLITYAKAVSYTYRKIKNFSKKDRQKVINMRADLVQEIEDLFGLPTTKAYDAVDDAIETMYLNHDNPILASKDIDVRKGLKLVANRLK